MAKIDIISGFLGAGKTTLIRKLIADALKGQQVALIENEFGEIGIDGGFLKEAGIEIREMSQGCICCSLVGDFAASLKEVMDTYHPDRILIEPTGVGKLSEIMKAIDDASADADLEQGSAVAVVDASKAKLYIRNFGEFFIDQISYAGTIVLTRVDKVSPEKVQECVALLREHNTKATIITTPISELDGKMILAAMEGTEDLQADLLREVLEAEEEDEDEHEHHHHHHDEDEDEHEHHHHHHDEDEDEDEHEHHHHHHHDEDEDEDEHEHHHHHHDEDEDEDEHEHHHEGVTDEFGNTVYSAHEHHHHHHHHHGHDADEIFESWGMETPAYYSEQEIRDILAKLEDEETYGIVLRSKGMLPAGDGSWIHFDYVPGEPQTRLGSADVTGKICVIGSGLKEDALLELFRRVK
ncbi:MAG: GTP-binding protein [Lachnospiraceae bacterium]|nr:GTP-binding protein [Lachnospiraceae bacterium]